MVLEELIRPAVAEKKPIGIFAMAFIISSISIWIFYHVFPTSSSVLALAFLTIGFVPLLQRVFLDETQKEIEAPGWAPGFIARHSDLFFIYFFLFLGLIASYTFWFVALPSSGSLCQASPGSIACFFPTREKVFAEQINTYNAIDPTNAARATGKAIAMDECKNPQTRSLEKCTMFIFNNNYFVLILATLFSFLYGAGTIFLIAWNASVIGTVIGAEIVYSNINSGITRFVGLIPHGTFEIGGYFIGAIAGGVISTALTTKKYSHHENSVIFADTAILIALAFVFLLVGAIIEAATIINPSLSEVFFMAEILIFLGIGIFAAFRKK